MMRIFDVSERMRMRRGAHAGLVREQAALGALGDSSPDAEERAAKASRRVERTLEDKRKRLRQVAGVHDEHDERTGDIKHGHDRHELFGNGC